MNQLEILTKIHSDLFNAIIKGETKDLPEVYNRLGDAICAMSQRSRERTVVTVCDEDLVTLGLDPETVSDERFERIVEEMQDFMDDSFQCALMEAISNTKETV